MKRQPDEPETRPGHEIIPTSSFMENDPGATHAKSHAAHLNGDKAQPLTQPPGSLRAGSCPWGRKQP